MNIRLAHIDDLPVIQTIYASARQFMRNSGNPDQWGEHHPPKALLVKNIEDRNLYVCMDDGIIVGVFFFSQGIDPTYVKIYDGEWLNDHPYGVIHHIAVAAHRKGVASFCFDYAFSMCRNVKIDTHRDNIPMQRSLEKNGFTYCGIIYLPNGDERIAYQKQ